MATRQGGVVQRTRETPKAEGTGRVGKKNSSREGLGDGGSRTSVEGRSHSPARRSSLRSERSRAQLTARQKDHKDLPSLFLSAHARSRSSASSFYADITVRKTNVVYNNNFSAVSRLLLPCLPRGIPPHFRAARIRVLAGCRQLATTAASAHSLVFLAKCTAFNYRRRKSRVATRQGGVVQRTRETPKAEGHSSPQTTDGSDDIFERRCANRSLDA